MRRGQEQLGAILVLGLGKSGKSVVRYSANLLKTRVQRVFVAAGEYSDDAAIFLESLSQPGLEYAFGDDALSNLDMRFDLCIASPGIPFWHRLYARGHMLSNELISEVEFAWRESSPESIWVAITGTNGKTTTVSLAASILRNCGFRANAVGNIGDVCLDAVAAGNTDIYVVEVSSYQLYSTVHFSPDIPVLLNITPDHFHWHRTFEAYCDAKMNVLRGGKLAVLDATNDVVRAKMRELKKRCAPYVPLGTTEGITGDMRVRCGASNAAFVSSSGELIIAKDDIEHIVGKVADFKFKGEHNVLNALAAAAIGVVLEADDVGISRALAAFQPLEHRIEPCGFVAGVECFNDSKATNVDATVKALGAFSGKQIAVLLGGDDKETDLADLVQAVHAHAHVAVCFGKAGLRIYTALDEASRYAPEGFVLLKAHQMEEALDIALGQVDAGDIILLSPACASFDEFRSFEHRGKVFKQLVAARGSWAGKEDGVSVS